MKVFFSNYTLQVVNIKKARQLTPYELIIDTHHGYPRRLSQHTLWLNPSGEDLEWLLATMRCANYTSSITVICASDKPKALRAVLHAQFRIIRAAGGVVTKPKGQILLIHRLGRWEFPKGKCHKKESLTHAAAREVEEECNIKVRCEDKLTTTYHALPVRSGGYALKKTTWFRMQVLEDSDMSPQKEEGIDEVAWLSLPEALERLEDSYACMQDVMSHERLYRALKRLEN